MKTKTRQQSFTLIELLVVIVIIGILSGLVVIATSSFIEKANFSKAQAFSSTIHKEMLSSLVSEWTFDEPEVNGKTKDTWGNNHGAVHGATQVDDCVYGKCYEFNGTTDYIECTNDRLPLGFSDRTISAWVFAKSIPASIAHIFHYGDISKGNSWGLSIRKNNLGLGAHEWTVTDSDYKEKISLKEWTFLVITLESSNIKTHYINGKNVGQLTRKPNTILGEYSAKIGTRISPAEYWHGSIDDVRIYNSALSSAQIKQNYIAGLNSMLANGNLSKDEYNERLEALATN